MRLWPVLLLALVVQVEPEAAGDEPPSRIAKLLPIFKHIFSAISAIHTIQKLINPDDTGKRLLDQFSAVTSRLDGLEREVHAIHRGPLWNLEVKVANQVSWGNTLQTLEELLRNVNVPYARFLQYQRNNGTFERRTLEDFADEIVSHAPDSVQSTMYSLQYLALGNDHSTSSNITLNHRQKRNVVKDGLFRQLQTNFRESPALVCGLSQSPRQLAGDILITLLVTLGKISAMVRFSYALLEMAGKGSYSSEKELYSQHSQNTLDAIVLKAALIMEDLPNEFWRCDPKSYERGRTYEEVTKLLQGYIAYEEDLSSTASCKRSCSDYKNTLASGCHGAGYISHRGQVMRTCSDGEHTAPCVLEGPFENWYCIDEQPCQGTVHDCRSFSHILNICLSKDNRRRRYEWIKYDDGTKLGSHFGTDNCYEIEKSSWVKWFVRCSYCFCLCDDKRNSDRSFSLLPAVSDVAENKIITGVRLVKKNRFFYIQLEQGVVGVAGYVKPSTLQWKPVDRQINPASDENGRDFMQLSYDHRSTLLLDLQATSDEVVTGIAFDRVGDLLSLRIRATTITEDGVLVSNSSRWITSSGQPRPRLDLGPDLKLPERFASPSWPDSESGQQLQFQASSVTGDVAQTTLPLLDVQEVAPRPAFQLSGVGLYHKGQSGSGGFIGLRVFQGW